MALMRQDGKIPTIFASKLPPSHPRSLPSLFLTRCFSTLWATIAVIAVIFGLLAEGNMTHGDRAELSTRPRRQCGRRVLLAVWKSPSASRRCCRGSLTCIPPELGDASLSGVVAGCQCRQPSGQSSCPVPSATMSLTAAATSPSAWAAPT
ncbi:hypothetical protein INR49_015171, partial [Caranx melampygus]